MWPVSPGHVFKPSHCELSVQKPNKFTHDIRDFKASVKIHKPFSVCLAQFSFCAASAFGSTKSLLSWWLLLFSLERFYFSRRRLCSVVMVESCEARTLKAGWLIFSSSRIRWLKMNRVGIYRAQSKWRQKINPSNFFPHWPLSEIPIKLEMWT